MRKQIVALQDYYLNCDNYLVDEAGQQLQTINNQVVELTARNYMVNHSLGYQGYGFSHWVTNPKTGIWNQLNILSMYISGELEPYTNNKAKLAQFLEIWPKFCRTWYFGTVYIGYGQKLLDIEKAAFKAAFPNESEQKLKEHCLYRIFTKGGDDTTYTSLISDVGNIKIDWKAEGTELIECSCNGVVNFMNWFFLLYELLAFNGQFIKALRATQKRVAILSRNDSKLVSELEQLNNDNVYLIKKRTQSSGKEDNTYSQAEFMHIDHPLKLLDTFQSWFEITASRLGYTGKGLNNKRERLLVAENFQNQKATSNVQKYWLNQLKVVAWRMIEKGWVEEDFEFRLSTPMDTEGMPMGAPGMPSGGSSGGLFQDKSTSQEIS